MATRPFALGSSVSSPLVGNPNSTKYVMADLADENGLVISGHCTGYAGTLDTTASLYQIGYTMVETDRGSLYTNIGTTASPSWFHIAGT